MSGWLGDIPAVVWTAIITGAFLIGQQWLNNRRDDKRRTEDATERQRERDHAATQARLDRDHERALAIEAAGRELNERWRDDRKEVHARMLRLLNAAAREISSAKTEKIQAIESGEGDPFALDPLTWETFTALDEAVADVRTLASDQSAADAWTVLGSIIALDTHVDGLLPANVRSSTWHDAYDKYTQQYYANFETYRASSRQDLGVSTTDDASKIRAE